ncbi:MAG: UDP-3-O-(3-hydroxymyristoyl)glucosamine N-acyltransferase [Azonexus sp.]|jgi:UDP-3-O-[3-hydroxymyristoyl] glucosamine N-acyltransferase|nr:UDP-3-O-(3-hydroxymyristoyl)glucosamine N-acyltransferase [Azonexus sp.]
MPDPAGIALALTEIAARLGGDVLGDGATRIHQVASLASAGEGEIAFLANRKYQSQLHTTRAAAVILPPECADLTALPRLVCQNPYACYARLAALLNPPTRPAPGVHASAASASQIPPCASIGAHVSIGAGVTLGERVVIHPGCVIGDGAAIGDDSLLYPHVTLYAACQIGRRNILHSGVVIGADGFGFAPDRGQWVKIPQIGRVIIGDDVEIGASTTVDRGALDDTRIGDGCKLDNQIQIGHNCVIGRHCVIAGCTVLAGSVTLADNVTIGGATQISGHTHIASGVVVSGGSTVMKSLSRPGQYTSIFPLEEHGRWLRNAAQIRHLERLAERVGKLEKILEKKL